MSYIGKDDDDTKVLRSDGTWTSSGGGGPHTHTQSDITNLVTDLAGKANSIHSHAISDVTNLQTGLDGKASTSHNHDGAYAAIGHSHPAGNLDSLSDVVVSSPSTGQVLKYDGSAWVNDTDATGAGGGLGYTINVQALTSSPVDAQTVYFGVLPKVPVTTANISKIYIRKAGTIKIAEIYCYSGTAGTNQAWSLYVRKNNTTDYLIATLSVATSERVFTNSSLGIPVVAGDYVEIKGVQPTWATNPLTTIYGGYLYVE